LFKRIFGCKLYINEYDKERVEVGDNMATTAELLCGLKFPPCKVDALLKDGDVYDFGDMMMEVMHTPGYTPGSVCFVLYIDNSKVLVAGNTVYGAYSSYIDSDEVKWRKSPDKICSCHFDLMIIGHSQACLLADADACLRNLRASFAVYNNL
jgi:glyoxylase-like metal-dependent hydrolase (beta-lactamase superfamily II)